MIWEQVLQIICKASHQNKSIRFWAKTGNSHIILQRLSFCLKTSQKPECARKVFEWSLPARSQWWPWNTPHENRVAPGPDIHNVPGSPPDSSHKFHKADLSHLCPEGKQEIPKILAFSYLSTRKYNPADWEAAPSYTVFFVLYGAFCFIPAMQSLPFG